MRKILITGSSGAGKSTLLAELARLGFSTIEEAGRRVVRQAQESGEDILPWNNLAGFLDATERLIIADFKRAQHLTGPVFIDRGLVDVWAAYQRMGREADCARLKPQGIYEKRVILVPPWENIYVTDEVRQIGFEAAVVEYESIRNALPELGYEAVLVPKLPPKERAQWVLSTFGLD